MFLMLYGSLKMYLYSDSQLLRSFCCLTSPNVYKYSEAGTVTIILAFAPHGLNVEYQIVWRTIDLPEYPDLE